MPVPCLDIRAAFLSAITNSTTGFNARLLALATEYAWPNPYTLDFSPNSLSFHQGYLQPETEDWNISQLSQFPAMAVYIRESLNENRTKFCRFDGTVVVCIDLFVKFRVIPGIQDTIETNDTDTVMDLSEAALMESIDSLAARGGSPLLPANITYIGRTLAQRSPIRLRGDAREQLLHVEIPFQVKQG